MSTATAAIATTIQRAQSQLFLDDGWIADTSRLTRVWHQARKHAEPVLKAEYPWEYNCPVAYGTVLKREGKFHMWYCGWTRGVPARVAYAVSDDGVHWAKPMLGFFEVCGSRQNNVVLQAEDERCLIDDITVIDDADDTQWPLKALFWESSADREKRPFGIYAARSKDGLRWEKFGCALPKWGDRFNAMSVKLDGKYRMLSRAPGQPDAGKGRVAYYSESQDLLHWSDPVLSLAADVEDPPHMEVYSGTLFSYAGRVLGSIERMHMSPDRLDTEIIWSDDGGRSWRRSRQRPRFIEWGQPGSWDDTWINLETHGPIHHDKRLWFFYSGRSGAHGANYPHNHGGIGLATLRIDGFCSLQAQEMTGRLLTGPMIWPGGELMLNVDPRRDLFSHPQDPCTGAVRVALRDGDNQPIEGFALEQCEPITRNTIDDPEGCAAVRWQGQTSADALKGRSIRLAVELRDAHLFSFRAQG